MRLPEVHAAVITHAHADHCHGLDDLRPFAVKAGQSIPVLAQAHTAKELSEKFPYIFQRHLLYQDRPVIGGGVPQLDLHLVDEGPHAICGEDLEFFSLPHGYTTTLGVRHGSMAYLVDCKEIPAPVIASLRKQALELLIIDCLREKPHDTHLHLDETLRFIEAIQPKLAVLTHMGHEFDYPVLLDQLRRRGATNVIPGVDGTSFLYS